MTSDTGRHRIPLAIRQLCGEIHLPHGKVPPGLCFHQLSGHPCFYFHPSWGVSNQNWQPESWWKHKANNSLSYRWIHKEYDTEISFVLLLLGGRDSLAEWFPVDVASLFETPTSMFLPVSRVDITSLFIQIPWLLDDILFTGIPVWLQIFL